MHKLPVKAVATALAITGIGAAVQAAPSFHSTLRNAAKAIQDEQKKIDVPYEWSSPNAIQAGLIQRGVSLVGGGSYATYKGRKFELKQEQLKAGLSDQVELFYGRQFVLAKGRQSTSRFYDDTDYYGGRVVLKKPTTLNPTAWAIQYEAFRPGTGQINLGSSSETLAGPKTSVYSLNYGDKAKDQFQLSYTAVDSPAGFVAHAVSAGAAHDFDLDSNLLGRLQLAVLGQSFRGPVTTTNLEIKPILTGSISWNAFSWLALEGDATVMPAGMPFVSGDFTGISTFAIYEPGGVVDDLRHNFLAFGSLRLIAHWNF